MGAPPPPHRSPDAAAHAWDLRDHADLASELPDLSDLASELPDPSCELSDHADLACELRDRAAFSPGPTSSLPLSHLSRSFRPRAEPLLADLPRASVLIGKHVCPMSPCSLSSLFSLPRADLLQTVPPQLPPPPPPIQDSPRPGSVMPDHHAGMTRCWEGRPFVLIDKICRTDCRTNATTASTVTSERFPIRVSFELADPPGISLCFVHCTGGNNRKFIGDPLILTSAQAFVLLVVSFSSCATHDAFHDYFVYSAGPGRPQLHRIPMPFPRDFDHNTVGILPHSDQYSIVIPDSSFNNRTRSMNFSLRVFSSKRKRWTTKEAPLARDSETDYLKAVSHAATEVISFGEGVLGWVDLWWGILLCNVVDENPMMRLLQWPVPEPDIEYFDFSLDHISPRPYREVTVVNDMIKFVELKFHQHTANQEWTATIWSRIVSSLDWHKNSTVDSHDVTITDSNLLSQMPFLLPEMLGTEANSLSWDQIICTSPTLSLTNDDIFHLMVKSNWEYPIAYVITVNTKTKALEAVEQCCTKKMTCLVATYMASAFSSYLRTIAGPAAANALECQYNVAGSNVENNVTVEPPPCMPKEQHKRTNVAASYSLRPAQKDPAKKSYASIVKQGPPTAVVKPKPVTKPLSIAVKGSTPELERPYIVGDSDVENNVTVEPHLPVRKKQPRWPSVAASSSLSPAPKDVTKNNYASTLEHGLSEPKQTLSDKPEQEETMLMYHHKYKEAMAALAQMEKRLVKTETMLKAALQYQSSQQIAVTPLISPRASVQDGSSQEVELKIMNLLESKGKQSSAVDCTDAKLADTHDQREETPDMDEEKQGEQGELRWTISKDGKLTYSKHQREETPNMDDEKQGELRWTVSKDGKLTCSKHQREETPNMDDEKQGEAPKLESEWTLVMPSKGAKHRQRMEQRFGFRQEFEASAVTNISDVTYIY